MIELSKSDESERAVSPVIGVILMVAITVILAAVIGAFVLGIGGDQQEAPQATLGLECEGTEAFLVHRGGDTLQEGELSPEGETNTDLGPGTGTDVFDGAELSAGETSSEQIDDGSGSGDIVIVHDPSESVILDRSFNCS